MTGEGFSLENHNKNTHAHTKKQQRSTLLSSYRLTIRRVGLASGSRCGLPGTNFEGVMRGTRELQAHDSSRIREGWRKDTIKI